LDVNCRLGYKVVVIDADIGLKLRFIVGLENRILYTVMDVFEGQCRLDQALIRDKRWKKFITPFHFKTVNVIT
jgi:septum site-determining protein MinD